MNDRAMEGSNATTANDWLDGLLRDSARDHADTYIGDDGFTARVMAALPALDAAPAWRKPAVTALWGAATVAVAFALPGAAFDVAREAFRLFAAKPFALSEIVAVLAIAGLGTWTTAYMAWKKA